MCCTGFFVGMGNGSFLGSGGTAWVGCFMGFFGIGSCFRDGLRREVKKKAGLRVAARRAGMAGMRAAMAGTRPADAETRAANAGMRPADAET